MLYFEDGSALACSLAEAVEALGLRARAAVGRVLLDAAADRRLGDRGLLRCVGKSTLALSTLSIKRRFKLCLLLDSSSVFCSSMSMTLKLTSSWQNWNSAPYHATLQGRVVLA